MDAVSFIAMIVMFVVVTTVRHYYAIGRSKAGREHYLLKRATRAAKSSQTASQTSTRLSLASSELSSLATVFFGEARQARDDGRFFRFVCLYLYGKWLFYRAGWLIGRAMQFGKRADAKLRESTAILDSLGVKRS